MGDNGDFAINEPEPKSLLEFPLDFPTCGVCGSTRTVAATVGEEERQKGKMGKDTMVFMHQFNSIILDPTRVALSVPVLSSILDICAGCGTVRCVHAELSMGIPQLQKGRGR